MLCVSFTYAETLDTAHIVVPPAPIIPTDVPGKIGYYADKYNVSSSTISAVIKCESSFNTNAIGDGGTSFGLAQIHLPAHPHVTREQAFDPDFAISFMAKEMSIGNSWKWSCYKKLYW
jgi:hypothetical protein